MRGGGWGDLVVSLSGLGQFVKGLLTTTAKVVVRFKERRVCYNLCDSVESR